MVTTAEVDIEHYYGTFVAKGFLAIVTLNFSPGREKVHDRMA